MMNALVGQVKNIKNAMVSEKIRQLAKIIWDYHHVNHNLEKADCILVLGSHDRRVAERGVELFFQGYAPIIMFSGGLGNLTKNKWPKPEADIFAEIALKRGVPKEKIIVENKSSNTGENILFSKKILQEKNINTDKIIIVQKPYMERRSLATFLKIWPEKNCIITSPQISFEYYPNSEISEEDVINIMVGDLQRIKIYPEKGFQVPQEIPENVWRAYEELVSLGYSKHLVK